MDNATLQLLRDQHKDVMTALKELKADHEEHLKEDRAVHKMVERHTMYFNIALLGLPIMFHGIAKKLGFLSE